jgi:AraC-like DNA-binding protein
MTNDQTSTNEQTSNPPVRLERMCASSTPPNDKLTIAPSFRGMERVAAFFRKRGYAPHRHDTYGIGVTTHGVQSFDYRGETRHSLAGDVYVLHPDEVHDGRPGANDGYGYRTLYLDPALVRDALDGAALPFVRTPVTNDPTLRRVVWALLGQMTRPIDDLRGTEMVSVLANALSRVSGSQIGGSQIRNPSRAPIQIDAAAVAKARDLLASNMDQTVTSGDLETATGHDRWSLSRQFRAAYGVSPHRFQTLRRLDQAQHLIRAGATLADAACRTGFSDQSHLSRHFRNAFGIPPGVWRSLIKSGAPDAGGTVYPA